MTISADLSGKTAFVTGASSGFGAHFAKLLAQHGARVVVGARRVEALKSLVSEIQAAGGQASAVALDVRDLGSIRDALAAAGPLDILVNNAGVGAGKPVLEQTEEDWSFVLDTNLRGAFFMATEAARAMREAGIAGSIVNIASILGLRQGMGVSTYAISKAGLIQLTKQLALELARYRIRVNALAPGYFGTDINKDFFDTEAGAALIKRVAMRRLGDLDDLDGPLLLLASDASKFMTGSVIAVDGGHLLSGL
ncbi:MAG: SDR family NAD(P)-dependent oxidoreductase [Hyphomonadaceae bacterium]